MRLPVLNNQVLISRYLYAFERRFVRVEGGTLYTPRETGPGVRLPDTDAARLIAIMRATMVEADEANPNAGPWAVPNMIGILLIGIIVATIFGIERTGVALFAPLLAIAVLGGPVLGLVRVHAAWADGVARIEKLLEAYHPVPAADMRRQVAPNHARPVVLLVLLFVGAVLAGLLLAAWTSPPYVCHAIDRWLAHAAEPVVLVIGLLVVGAAIVDALTRRRVSEAEIEQALAERRGRPLR